MNPEVTGIFFIIGTAFGLASVLGLLMFFVGSPAVTACLYAMPKLKNLFISIMVFSTCIIKKPYYQEVFFQNYRGVDRGYGVTVPDLLFFGLAIYIILGGLKRKIIWLPYNTIPWVLMIIIAICSLFGSSSPFYGSFAVHKFIRCLILYWVVVNLCLDRESINAVVSGLIAAVVCQGTIVIWEKYIVKTCIFRSMGSFPHPNTLAMYIDMILPVLVGLLLVKGFSKKQELFALYGIATGFISVIFTKSRAAMVILPAGLMGVVCISMLFKPTLRKAMIIVVALIFTGGVASIAMPRIIARFQKAPKESAETRHYFNDAAKAMAKEHFFGVGVNLYSKDLAETEYYWYVYPDKVDLPDPEAFREGPHGKSRLGNAHHIYLLFAGETGWIGMWCFVFFIARFYLTNIILFFTTKDENYRAIILGLLFTFGILHIHGKLEWVFRQTQCIYMFFILSGLMIGIREQNRLLKKNKKKKPKPKINSPQKQKAAYGTRFIG